MTEQPLTHTADDNLLAAIAHLCGFFVALIVWIFQKDKSHFVRYQAVQAMAFDVVVSVIVFIVANCVMALIVAALVFGIGDIALLGSQNNPTAEPVRVLIALMGGVPFLVVCIISLLGGAIFIARLVATIQTFQGKNFQYPWLGLLVERLLEKYPVQPISRYNTP